MSKGEGCETVGAITKCGWATVREYVELVYGKKQKFAVYKSYVRPAILYWCEVRCLRENDFFSKDRDQS